MMVGIMRKAGRSSTRGGRGFGQGVAVWLLLLGGMWLIGAPAGAEALSQKVEVRNLGISRLGERSMLTVLLDRPARPQVAPYAGAGRSQLIVDFPGARAGRLPERLEGDEVLVKHVRTEVSEAGIKIIVEMVPEKPYIWKREVQSLSGGRAMFRLTMWADPKTTGRPSPPAALPPPPQPLAPRVPETAPSPPKPTPAPGPGDWKAEEAPAGPPIPPAPAPATPASGEYAELYRLLPQAQRLLDYLRGEGWSVAQTQRHDRPGVRFSQSFQLTNPRFPELTVRIAHVPPNAPGAPTINIVDLSMDRLTGKAADEYRSLRKWDFGKIKTKFEDIGDFFDDALKPLRVELRQQCQSIARRHAAVIKGFLGQAVPGKPQLGDKVLTLIGQKVSPRFEGVQYTLSENPLVILNLVDFLYIRVYFLEG